MRRADKAPCHHAISVESRVHYGTLHVTILGYSTLCCHTLFYICVTVILNLCLRDAELCVARASDLYPSMPCQSGARCP